MNRTTFFLIFSMLTLTVHAQHYQHKTFWTRGLVTAPLSKKWDFFGEYIHRQQNEIGSNNPFSHASFQEVRLWGYYKYKNWVFQVNPYTFIHSVPFLGKPADYNANPNFDWCFLSQKRRYIAVEPFEWCWFPNKFYVRHRLAKQLLSPSNLRFETRHL